MCLVTLRTGIRSLLLEEECSSVLRNQAPGFKSSAAHY